MGGIQTTVFTSVLIAGESFTDVSLSTQISNEPGYLKKYTQRFLWFTKEKPTKLTI